MLLRMARRSGRIRTWRDQALRWGWALCLAASWWSSDHAVAGGPDSGDWSMFRGNAQLTGVAPGSLGDDLKVRWKFEAGEAVTSTAAIVGDTVYVGSDDGALFALDLADGTVRWKFKTEEAIRSSPAVVNDLVLFGDAEGVMHAVSASTGDPLWTFRTEGEIVSSPTPVGDRMVFGSYDGSLYALSIADGRLLWKFETQGRIHGTAGVADGRVLVAGCDEHLYSVSLADGSGEPCVSMGSVTGTAAAMDDSMVFVGTYGGSVLGVDWRNRRTVWRFDDPQRDYPCMSSAAIGKNAIIVGGRDKRLRAIDKANGRVKWEFAAKGRIDSSPVIVGDRVFVGASDGLLYAIRVDTGEAIWRFEAGSPISASPAIARGCLVIGTEDGLVYCFASP